MNEAKIGRGPNYYGIAALGVAALGALFVVAVYIVGADDGDSLPAEATTDQTPAAGGVATPLPDTGPLVPDRPSVGSPAPDFALADVRDPARIRKLSDFAGRPVVLNWYASWCDPCRREMPAFQAAQGSLGDAVVFLGVNYQESRDDALSILEDTGASFAAVMDPSGSVSEHYRITRGLPITMFIDADGILRSIHQGEVTEDELADELAKIGLVYRAP